MKSLEKKYEAPRTEVVLMDTNANVFMASPDPSAGITGGGFHFTEDGGSW